MAGPDTPGGILGQGDLWTAATAAGTAAGCLLERASCRRNVRVLDSLIQTQEETNPSTGEQEPQPASGLPGEIMRWASTLATPASGTLLASAVIMEAAGMQVAVAHAAATAARIAVSLANNMSDLSWARGLQRRAAERGDDTWELEPADLQQVRARSTQVRRILRFPDAMLR